MITAKQESYLLSLANQVSGRSDRFLSQARDILGLSSFQLARITRAQASALIDELKARAGAR